MLCTLTSSFSSWLGHGDCVGRWKRTKATALLLRELAFLLDKKKKNPNSTTKKTIAKVCKNKLVFWISKIQISSTSNKIKFLKLWWSSNNGSWRGIYTDLLKSHLWVPSISLLYLNISRYLLATSDNFEFSVLLIYAILLPGPQSSSRADIIKKTPILRDSSLV